MTVTELLAALRSKKIRLWTEGDKLKFNAPKGALTADLRDQIKTLRSELILFLQQTQQSNPVICADHEIKIVPAPAGGKIVLSAAQRRLWFLDQLESGSAAYNMPSHFLIEGTINEKAFHQAYKSVVAQNNVLRTIYCVVDGKPEATVQTVDNFALKSVNLSQETDPVAEKERLLLAESRLPFNLEAGPAIRATLIKLTDVKHIFTFTVHHIAFDGWSVDLLINQISKQYAIFCSDETPLTKPIPLQYSDFSYWQERALTKEKLKDQWAFWERQFAGELPILQLPQDISSLHVEDIENQQEKSGNLERLLPENISVALNEKCQNEGVTPFMMMFTLFQVLLHRLSGQDDLITGTPSAGRTKIETEEIIGCFLNTLAIRTQFKTGQTFDDLLQNVKKISLETFENQDVPFEKLVEHFQPRRDLKRHPFFDVMFNYVSIKEAELKLSDATVTPIPLTEVGSKFWLTLYVQESAGQFNLDLVYRADLFSVDRMQVFLDQFAFLAEQIVANPAVLIQDLSLVTPESQSVIPDLTTTFALEDFVSVADRFDQNAHQNHDLVGISWQKKDWTYQQLQYWVHDLATRITGTVVENQQIIAISGQRSPGFMVSMLAVLKSGHVLLTLDPKLPLERRQLMLKTANASAIIYVGEKPAGEKLGISEIQVPLAVPPADIQPASFQTPKIDPDSPAYIFFTSGTTGVPKGVLGRQRGLSHFLAWQGLRFNIGPGHRFAQLTGLSFDVVLRDVLTPLTHGATLCLPDDENDFRPDRLLPWMDRMEVTAFHTVPSLLRLWLNNAPAGVKLNHLKWLFSAGEPLSDALVNQWRRTFPSAGDIVNLYGPTETTLAKCHFVVPNPPAPGIQPVGVAIPGAQAVVLSNRNVKCGIGETGEIVIRTPYRSLGYLNADPNKASQFIPNPENASPEDILYRTGDQGRFRPDGILEILGRQDHQIKIRGIRVEPDEIARQIETHPAIKQSLVLAIVSSDRKKDDHQEKQLVAYIVASETDFDTEDVKIWIRKKLPEYMVPAQIMLLDQFPLNPNGKVNRKALPAFDFGFKPIVAVKSSESSRNDTEELLIKIWAETLNVSSLGIHDNFFDLGGHSLLAVPLLAKVEEAFNKDLPMAMLFNAPTVAQMSEWLLRDENEVDWASLVPVQAKGSLPPLYVVHGAGGNVLSYGPLAKYLGTDQPVYGLQAQGLDGRPMPYRSVEEMAAHYVHDIRKHQPKGPYYLGGYSAGGVIAFEMAQKFKHEGDKVNLLVLFDSAFPTSVAQEIKETPKVATGQVVKNQSKLQKLLKKGPLGIVKWAGRRVAFEFRMLKVNWQRSAYKKHLRRGTIIPQSLRSLYVSEANRGLVRNYEPKPYDGTLTYFEADIDPDVIDGQGRALEWQMVAAGGLEIVAIPGPHDSITKEPFVQVWAKQLKQVLQRRRN